MKNRHLLLVFLLVLAFLAFSVAPALAGTGHGLTSSFGGAGSTEGKFNQPSGVAVNDATGDVYVVDKGNRRVEYFNSTGTKVEGEFDGTAAPTGALEKPTWVAVDNCTTGLGLPCSKLTEDPSVGDVYVTGEVEGGAHHVIYKFSATGAYLSQITTGEGGAAFSELEGIAVDSQGQVWVDQSSAQIDSFSDAEPNEFLSSRDSQAFQPNGSGHETFPGFAVDSEDNLYVVYGDGYAAKLNSAGEILGEVLADENSVAGLAVDLSSNNVYFDSYNNYTQHFVTELSSTASEIERFGEGRLGAVSGIGVDSASGAVYVADVANDDVAIFTVGARPEPPETLKAEPVTSTTAKLHGKLLDQLKTKLEYYFEYKLGTSCAGGLKTPVEESEGGEVAKEITGLEPSAEYTYCLVAKNTYGREIGSPETFPTLGAKPEIISESASGLEREKGQFEAKINPNNSETTYYFEYSTSEEAVLKGEGTPVSGGSSLSAEFGALKASVEAEQEEVTATYYYRVVATNATGTSTGEVQAYTKLPEVLSETAFGLTLTEATLQASIKAHYQTTEFHFEYATGENAEKLVEEGKGTQVPGEYSLEPHASEDPALPASIVLSGLPSNTTYYYRVVAENSSTREPSNADKGEPVRGEIKEFTTRSLPFVSTGGVQDITRTTATLSGTVLPRFLNSTYYFAYISEAGFQAALAEKGAANPDGPGYEAALAGGAPSPYAEGETTTPIALEASESPQAVGPLPAAGLLPGTTYHYALVSKNEFGVRYGEDHTFTTLAGTPPIVSTGGVSGVSQNSATLSGTVSTNSLQTEYGFEIGTSPGSYGPATGLGSIGGAQTEAVSVTLGELQPGTTYYYRVTATNADGTTQGAPGSFTTPGFPTLISGSTALPFVPVPNVAFPAEEKAGRVMATKPLTNKQKLAKALKQCRRKQASKRTSCERTARKRFGPGKKRGRK